MFSNVFKTIQFYPKGGLTIQLWRTGRFVELDPTLRQSDGSGGWIELKTTEQRYKSYKRMISRWYKGGLKLYMRWFRSKSSWTHSFLFCCCQSFEDSFLSSWLAAGLGWTMVDWHLWLIPVTLVNLGDSALSAHTTDMPQKIQKIHNFGW